MHSLTGDPNVYGDTTEQSVNECRCGFRRYGGVSVDDDEAFSIV